jgi:hypothetical protein
MRTRTLGTLLAAALVLGAAFVAPPALAGARKAKPGAAKPPRSARDTAKRPEAYLMWVERDGVPTLVGEGTVPPAPRIERVPRAASVSPPDRDVEWWAANWGPDADPVPQQYELPPDRVWESEGVPLSYVYAASGYPYVAPFAAYPFFPRFSHKGYGRAAYGRAAYGRAAYGRAAHGRTFHCPPPRRPAVYAGASYASGPRVAAPRRGGYGRVSTARYR